MRTSLFFLLLLSRICNAQAPVAQDTGTLKEKLSLWSHNIVQRNR